VSSNSILNPVERLGSILRAGAGEIIEQRQREAMADADAARRQAAAEHRDEQLVRADGELRSSLENPSTPLSYPAEWLLDMWNGGATDAGIRVSELTALQVTTCFACVNLISNSIGGMDCNVYELMLDAKKHAGKRVAFEHALYDLLHDEPNPEMTAFTFFKTLQVHALLWGNCYAEIQRDKGNRVVALWPRNPAKSRPYRLKSGLLVYRSSEGMEELTPETGAEKNEGPERTILAEDMIHIPGLSLDGRVGSSVIWLTRQAFGVALASEKFGSKLFANGARPGGILSHPGTLKPLARETLKNSWQAAQGGENVFKTAVLEEGIKWTDNSIKPNEGQFLETRQFQKTEICSIFAVPPHMVGDTEKSNRANTEQLGIEFVTFSLSPWLKSWQAEMKRKLFSSVGRSAGKFFPKFDTRPLTMADAASRKDFYMTGKQWGFLSTNNILELEHMNPSEQPGADLLWIPINMTIMSDAPTPEPGVDPAASAAEPEPDKLGKRYVRAYWRLFRDAFGRLSNRETIDSRSVNAAFMPLFLSVGEQLETLAGDQFGVDLAENSISDSRFLRDYCDAIVQRASSWKGMASSAQDETALRELSRAVRAISIEVYRSLATAKAKAQTEA
jgi:HK97 family phage portal protein